MFNKWIASNKKLPIKKSISVNSKTVLIVIPTHSGSKIQIGSLFYDSKYNTGKPKFWYSNSCKWNLNEISHWKPLPKLPKLHTQLGV